MGIIETIIEPFRGRADRAVATITVLGAILASSGILGCSEAIEAPGGPAERQLGSPGEQIGDGTSSSPGDEVFVAETWVSLWSRADNIDSVAYWQGRAGNWVIATAKASHQLLVYGGQDGRLLRRVAGPGQGPGQLRRPNGIQVVGDLAFVVERDNHRVQVFRLPHFESLATFGEPVLRRPYGLTVFSSSRASEPPGRQFEVFVTDNYGLATPPVAEEPIPPDAQLGKRVRHFRVEWEGQELSSQVVRAFGATAGPGVLRKVETLVADPAMDRILVAEELEAERVLKVYDLQGRFREEVWGAGYFLHEPEGLALRACPGRNEEGAGYWVATDQAAAISYFRVFDRADFAYRGTFVGPKTANTDGVALTSLSSWRFPRGAFFAVHDDRGVTAFDWRDIAAALELDPNC